MEEDEPDRLHVEAPDTPEVDQPDGAELHTALPPRMESWRRRSVAGAILTGFGLGLKEVFEPQREEAAVVVQASGDPPGDLPVEADLGGILPSDKVVTIRPWLLSESPAPAAPPSADDAR